MRETTVMGDPDAKRFGALPSASGGIARLAYARAKTAGVDTDPLLRKAGITQRQIEDPGLRLKVLDQVRFLNLVAAALPDDYLGFHLAMTSELREIGLLYYISASSETLGQAIQQASRYSSIVNEGVVLQYSERDDVKIAFHYVGVSRHIDQHQIEFFVTTTVRICRQLTGQRIMPTGLRLTHRRDAINSEFFDFFGDNVEFGATVDEVAFAPSARTLPVVGADPYLNKLLVDYAKRRGAANGAPGLFAQASRMPSYRCFHTKAQAAEIATASRSQRTLARRLTLEGVTFSEVLDRLKSHLAQRYLADESLSISQIAWLLGYQEVSAFTHAFKRWTGKTPREARS
jgi:AraC-like DNA-binding protein